MSLSGQRAQSFFDPLMGKTATFVVESRQANLEFARTIVALLAKAETPCAVFDLDAFYSSNADRIFKPLTGDVAHSTVIRVPEPASDVEGELARLFEVRPPVVIIDSLNSLYHLLSIEDGSARSRKLNFAVASLSYLARTNAKAVVLTMYRREALLGSGSGRSISSLSDVTASVEVRGPELRVVCERGTAWAGGRFSTRSPSV
ncbi:MAG TPA: hypothetical protein VK126_03485 [Nitrososphaerales archaeon]|nr:hypothetical protein [Nitrososphaerales archaeon]